MERIGRWLKKYMLICVIFQIVILGVLTAWCLNKERAVIEAPLESWQSELIAFDGTSWYIDEQNLGSLSGSSYVEMLVGPYMELPRGSYTVSITYSSEETNYCKAVSGGGSNDGLKADGAVALEPGETQKSFRIEAAKDINAFEIQIIYGGTGFLEIKDITIRENRTQDVRRVVSLFFIFGALDIILLAGSWIKRERSVAAALCAIACAASLPEMIADFYWGHDIWFHFLRIEGIVRELQLGNFPARIHSLCLDGYGYPMSIYYGDIFLYFPALLRLGGVSIVNAYKIYIFAVNAATTGVSYICFHKIFKERSVALLGTLIYVTGAYRLADIYVRAAVGEYTAMMAFPILALALYRIYEADGYEDWKRYRKNAWILAAGMTVLIGSHMLSTEMTVFVMALICVVLYKRTFRKNTLCVYVLAVVETILLNAYFLLPLLDYWKNVAVNITVTMSNTAAKISDYGAYVGQYFAFFASVGGSGTTTISGRMQMTPGLLQMAALLAAAGLLIAGIKKKRWLFYAAFSVLALWLASDIFPWDYLAAHVGFFNLLAQVQFPWRYIGIAGIFLTLLSCELLVWLKETRKGEFPRWCLVISVCAVLMTSYITGNIYDGLGSSDYLDTYDVASVDTMAVGGGEYLRTWTDKYSLSGDIVWENLKTIELRRQEGTELEFYCESDGAEAYIEVPLLNYKGYHVRDDAGNEYEIEDGENNVISFRLPSDFAGVVTVSFEEPVTWRIAEIVSLVTAMGLLGTYLWTVWRKKKAETKNRACVGMEAEG